MIVTSRKNLGSVYAGHDLGLHIIPTCPGWCFFIECPWDGVADPLRLSGFRCLVSLMDCEKEFFFLSRKTSPQEPCKA
ncbi:hypothetical protein E2C01_031096 [Portunus trituberculatus]|uniref:Uncharacterized protein n=1 Tax=Portunus trituberculatus TaxID=210409 RepID=A0A5B7ES57_PORTR|nr:hypothetical protein [Portunus trituberculatus]